MNAPMIWVFSPLVVALISMLFRKQRLFVLLFVGIYSSLLAILALTLKIDLLIPLGPFSVEISSVFDIFGRKFILEDSDRFILALIYGIGAVWFFGSRISGSNENFCPNGLGILAIMVATLSVQPFLYAALLIEFAVLLSFPMFIYNKGATNQGVLRYLIFQTLAIPFILLAGWGFEQAPLSANSQEQYLQAAILLGLGFAFWLAVFPFYSWVPLLASEGQPYVAGFIFFALPTTSLLLLLDFFNNYNWMRNEVMFSESLRLISTIMIVSGGIWAAFQKSLIRLFGYAVIVETGFALLSLSLSNIVGWTAYIQSFLPRLLAIAILSLSLASLRNSGETFDLNDLKGVYYRYPFVSSAFLIAWFSICGFPILAAFPTRLAILSVLASESIVFGLWVVVGVLGMFFAGFQVIGIFFSRENNNSIQVNETVVQAVFLSLGTALLILVGLFPNIFLSPFTNLLLAYRNLT
ncbi:MAG: hypothetical protein CVU39_18265 [Chloroflexi bacterium HGW-Chloroflexi-10]|nr:MAG: hypothetical protein CVU39_18265 [Chloroflexi bacterium HGW-Chloroflexi-10]